MQDDFKDEQVDRIRDPQEVARRSIVLYAVISAGHDVARDELVTWLRQEGLWDAVTPEETALLLSDSPTDRQRAQAQWRVEVLLPLLWALGLIAELPSPQQICDVPSTLRFLPPIFSPVGEFIASAKLRSDKELQDANEEIYQINWRVRDFQLRNEPTPPGRLPRTPTPDGEPPADSYNAGVVEERHYALNWLIGYCGQDWDDIMTDT